MHIAKMDETSTVSPPRKPAWPRLLKRGHSQLVWDKTNGRCWYCGQTLVPATDGDIPNKDYGPKSRWFTIDHIEPRASRLRACSRLPPLLRTGVLNNKVPSCHSCNSIKHHDNVECLRQRLGLEFFYYERVGQIAIKDSAVG